VSFVLIGGQESVNNLLRATFAGVVADLGAGSGSKLDAASTLSLAELVPRIHVQVDRSRDPAAPGAVRIRADLDAERLPFRDAVFDGVACTHVLEHLHHPERVLREVHRCLRPSGMLVAAVPNGRALSDLLFRAWHRLFHGRSEDGSRHVQRYTLHAFLRLLEVTGFDVVSFSEVEESFSWLGKHPRVQRTLAWLFRRLLLVHRATFLYGWHVVARKKR
jgi:SAM-dependent methyltransferase